MFTCLRNRLITPFIVFLLSGFAADILAAESDLSQAFPGTTLPASALPQQAELETVAQLFVWKKLIQTGKNNTGGDLATVLSDHFYLSGSDKLDPIAELKETLKAFANNRVIAEEHAACRFPARFLWLSKQFPTLAEKWTKPSCPDLEKWVNLDDLEGISLLQVSGYFGNPASAFGHLLLQVNRKGSEGFRGLQDTGVNFGAKVPDGENMMAYVLRGLFGSYNASFSKQEFYAQDHVYSATEFRDMWAYELNLTDHQQQMILYHIWELKDALFKYYFLKINCAFHLAQLMEIAFETDFRLHNQPWYLPVSVFHELTDADAKDPGRIIKSIDFIPSVQRQVHIAFDKLSKSEKAFANRYVVSENDMAMPDSASDALLEFLLLYVDYRSQGLEDEELISWRERRTPILLARLRLPASTPSDEPSLGADQYPPPASGPKSRKVGLGIYAEKGEARGPALVVAPFAYDLLNKNTGSLVDSNFKLGETTIINQDGFTRLERFELISIEKLAPPVTGLAGEQKWTWGVALGVKHFERRCDRCLTPMVEGAVGRSARLGAKLNLFGFATGELNRLGADAGLSAGVLWQMLPRLRWRAESQAQLLSTRDGIAQSSQITHSVSGLLHLSQNWDVLAKAEFSEDISDGTVVLNYRW